MKIQVTAPPATDVAARYVEQGLWGRPQHVGAVEAWAARDPDRIAVIDPYGRFTYGELETSIRRARAWVEDVGIEPGDPVVAVLPNWFESVAFYHALLRAGAVPVPLSTHARHAEVASVVAATASRVLVVPESHAAIAGDLAEVGVVARTCRLAKVAGAAESTALRGRRAVDAGWVRTEGVAVVLCTSGTTATPKGAIHTHDTLAVANRNLTWCLALDEDDVYYVPAPLGHIGGLMHALHMPYETGARVVLDDRWDPDRAAARIVDEHVTFIGGAPVFPQGLVRAFAGRGGSPLRVVCTGGAVIPDALGEDVRRVLHARLVRSYGATEFPFVAGSLPTDGADACDANDGALMPGVQARVVDGELLLRGAAMFHGYVDPVQTAGALRDGWLATGDVVTLRGERLKVAGRLKAIAIRNGENISLDEIERALATWTDAAEVAAFSVPDPVTGEHVALAVVARASAAPTYAAMVAHLDTRGIARQKYPEEVTLWDELPRTASGKVDRRELAAKASARPSDVAPRLHAQADV